MIKINTSTILVFTLVIVVMGSCNKFLETKPRDVYSPEIFYANEEQLNSALATVYSNMANLSLYGQYVIYNGFDADLSFQRSLNASSIGPSAYNVSATEVRVAEYWRLCYLGIERANLLLANINKPEMKEDARKVIKGEALFLRAFYYFMLVQNFGPVPMKLEPTIDGSNTRLARSPVRDVYDQILKDMEEADTLVKPITAYNHGGRISRSAVRGILARVNLLMAGSPLNDISRYAEAKKWSGMIIDEGYHELNNDFSQVFINYSADKYDPKETIWEIELYGNAVGMWSAISGRIGTYGGVAYSDEQDMFSYGTVKATGILWDKYDNYDKLYSYDQRRDSAIAPYRLAVGTPPRRTYLTSVTHYNRDCGKYKREYEVVSPRSKNYSPVNFPMLRYSDVLLMYAEAENAINGPTEDAISKVNEVRRRGYGKYLNGRGGIAESIATITVSNGGAGYVAASTKVEIIGGGGIGATATATVTSGRITAITITNPGARFTSVPQVVISGVGSGATALASLTSITDADLKPADYAGKEAFLVTIQDERARELCFEALRKADLNRWGILIKNMELTKIDIEEKVPTSTSIIVPYRNFSPRDTLWPIPSYEMGLNPALTQNPGW